MNEKIIAPVNESPHGQPITRIQQNEQSKHPTINDYNTTQGEHVDIVGDDGPTETEKTFFARLAASDNRFSHYDEYDPDVIEYCKQEGFQVVAADGSQLTLNQFDHQPPDSASTNTKERYPGIINLADIDYKPTEWLWDGFIPKGKVTLLAGEQGVGKSTALAYIAAEVTKRGNNVIYQNAEDDIEDTMKLNFMQAGAIDEHIFIIDDSKAFLGISDERWEKAISKIKPALVVIDPIQAFLKSNVDMNKANAVREHMKHLTMLARDYSCAIIVVCHLTKFNYSKVLTRILGSTDFSAAARQVLAAGENPDNKLDRAITVVKSNVGKTGISWGYTINEKGFVWTGKSELTEEIMFSNNNYRGTKVATKLNEAKELLKRELSSGPKDGTAIRDLAKNLGIADQTLRRAREELNIKPGSGGNSAWVLPNNQTNTSLS